MSNNNPKSKPKAKKVNGRKSWLKVAKKVHELNKKKKLGWTWSESMKFASQKVYPNFKGLPQHKISLKNIEGKFNYEIENNKQPLPKGTTPKPIQICDDVRQIPDEDLLVEYDWYLIAEDIIWSLFTANMPMRFAFDGIIDTGIIPKYQMPDMKDIREQMRKLYGNVSDPMPQFIFKRLIQPNKKDDGNPCSYYVLVTMLDGSYDITGDDEVSSNKYLTEEEKMQRAKEKIVEKKSKSKAKARKRPKEVEPKSITKPTKKESDTNVELEKIKIQKESRDTLERILNGLRQDFKDGIITKRQFQQRQQLILEKFEKGGKV